MYSQSMLADTAHSSRFLLWCCPALTEKMHATGSPASSSLAALQAWFLSSRLTILPVNASHKLQTRRWRLLMARIERHCQQAALVDEISFRHHRGRHTQGGAVEASESAVIAAHTTSTTATGAPLLCAWTSPQRQKQHEVRAHASVMSTELMRKYERANPPCPESRTRFD